MNKTSNVAPMKRSFVGLCKDDHIDNRTQRFFWYASAKINVILLFTFFVTIFAYSITIQFAVNALNDVN